MICEMLLGIALGRFGIVRTEKGKMVILQKRACFRRVPKHVSLSPALNHAIKVVRENIRDYIGLKVPEFTKVSKLSVLRREQSHVG